METIFEVLRRKEAEVAVLQAEIEKLRAAAEIIAREQAIAADKTPSANIEEQLQAAVTSSKPLAPAPAALPLKRTLP